MLEVANLAFLCEEYTWQQFSTNQNISAPGGTIRNVGFAIFHYWTTEFAAIWPEANSDWLYTSEKYSHKIEWDLYKLLKKSVT